MGHLHSAVPLRAACRPSCQCCCDRHLADLVLQRHDLLFYLEGGRSYSGELKAPKTGLLHAALQAGRRDLVVVPVAIAYDIVLEDHILARQGQKRRQRPFARELAEMVRFAVGYQSRAFVTFGAPIPVGDYDPESRRDVHQLARQTREAIGRSYKVLPTALVAAAVRPSITRSALEERLELLIQELRGRQANLGVRSARQAADEGIEALETRGVVVVDREGKIRVRERRVLRYYARTIEHHFTLRPPGRTH